MNSDITITLPSSGGGGGTGDVNGPASSINNDIVLFDGVTGKLIKDSGYQISDLLIFQKIEPLVYNNATIKALPTTAGTTGIEVVAGITGKILLPVFATFTLDPWGADYSNIDPDFRFRIDMNSDGQWMPLVQNSILSGGQAKTVVCFNDNLNNPGNIALPLKGEPLSLYFNNQGLGDLLDGDDANVLTIQMIYWAF